MLLVDGADITQIAENARYVSLWNNGPGTLTFEYAAGKGKMYPNGCTVTFSYEGSNVFYGWLFKTSQTRDKFKCTCYDQLRYLKAKNSILREVEPLDSFLNRVGATHGDRIRLGQVDSTEYPLPRYLFDNQTYLDMLYQSIQENLYGNGYQYTLRDNFGALDLRDTIDLRLPLIIGDKSLATDFEYVKSIDEDTYNHIKVAKDRKDIGTRYTYEAQDGASIAEWGKLTLYEKVTANYNEAQLAELAQLLLQIRDRETETLKVECLGDTRVMAGSGVRVVLKDTGIDLWAIVDTATHEFGSPYKMTLNLIFGRWPRWMQNSPS